ncbi:g1272 [Coccomyxa viridis]|uniref:G1272 protein n=1 Tax=Coccomyxa viridis TaxID=1274662 RepID=A0ABP1FKJ7_9CHLO
MVTTRAQGSGGSSSETKQKYTLKSEGGGTYKVAGGQTINVATAGVNAFVRLGSGAFVSGKLAEFRKRPKEAIILYEFDGCPFCRKVREACSLLDLDVLFYPCPKDGPNFRPKAKAMSGKGQFPFLVDPNTGKQMLESDAIINYLWNEYGDGQVPIQFKLGPLTTISIGVGLLARGGRGTSYRKSNLPKEPIEIWGYEASPFVKLAREVLTELELPHLYHSVARNSPKRPLLTEKWGSFQVPYIEDPNTGTAMFESSKIIEYLNDTYAVK